MTARRASRHTMPRFVEPQLARLVEKPRACVVDCRHALLSSPRWSKPAPPPDDPEQSQRFIDMAREVEADGSKEQFEKAFKKIAKEKPEKAKR